MTLPPEVSSQHSYTNALVKKETFKVLLAGFSLRVSLASQVKIGSSIPLTPFTSPPSVFSGHHLNGSSLLAHLPFSSVPQHHTIFSLVSLFLQPKPENAVTVAVSSRVLFRTEREQKVFEQKGVEEYLRYQIEHENEPFAPGPAFPFVKVKVTQTHPHRHNKQCRL